MLPSADSYSAGVREKQWLEGHEQERPSRRKLAVLAGFSIVALLAVGAVAWHLTEWDVPVLGTSPLLDASEAELASSDSDVPPPDCSKKQFADAIEGTSVEETAREVFDPKGPLINPPEGFGIQPLICADVTGDGIDDMVGGLATGASFHTTIWAAFVAGAGEWELGFQRDGFVISDLEARGGSIQEKVPTFGVGDPLCCPSGERTNRVRYSNGDFQIVFSDASPDRGIVASEEKGMTALGPLDLAAGSVSQAGPDQATAAFRRSHLCLFTQFTRSHLGSLREEPRPSRPAGRPPTASASAPRRASSSGSIRPPKARAAAARCR
jgi:hypothetical protein